MVLGHCPSVARLLSQCSLDATVQSQMWTCNSVSVDVQLEGMRVAVSVLVQVQLLITSAL